MTEVNQADLFTGRAPVDEDLTPAQRMKLIRRRFGRCRTQTEDGRCTAWTTSDGQPMEITPERCLRCRGMTNAYFGDPGKPGAGLRGGEGSHRRAELDKLYPAEIEERIKGIQSGAGWPEASRRGLDWHYEKHREDLELSTSDEWSLDQYQAESLRVIREADRVMTYHKPGTTDTVRWGFYESASGLYAAVDGQSGAIATMFGSEYLDTSAYVEV
ncbi:MAG: hypothetical protein GF399_06435 [Candidatus Coatesbacteria bacterium]|nr:hypothetical protein [Candidatus Coatesbacteria bacterium]